MQALRNAPGIANIPIDLSPDYPDVTATAKPMQ
jgi:hypothetical protein